jgi:hypothetical protein
MIKSYHPDFNARFPPRTVLGHVRFPGGCGDVRFRAEQRRRFSTLLRRWCSELCLGDLASQGMADGARCSITVCLGRCFYESPASFLMLFCAEPRRGAGLAPASTIPRAIIRTDTKGLAIPSSNRGGPSFRPFLQSQLRMPSARTSGSGFMSILPSPPSRRPFLATSASGGAFGLGSASAGDVLGPVAEQTGGSDGGGVFSTEMRTE